MNNDERPAIETNGNTSNGYHTPAETISRIGAFTPLHITRCKDCVYYEYGEHFPDMRFCCRLHGEDGTPVRYNFEPNAFCSYGETPEEKQQREAAEREAWESIYCRGI